MTIWFTADWHLGHFNIIKYCNRPFEEVIDMRGTILQQYNDRVKHRDTVYFLGDLAFRDVIGDSTIQAMNGKKHFIRGNHDISVNRETLEKYCRSVSDIKEIVIEGQWIVLCHYPMRTWNKSHHGSWQLHGHSHGTVFPLKNQLDVGVDCNNYHPVSYQEIKRKIKLNNERLEEEI